MTSSSNGYADDARKMRKTNAQSTRANPPTNLGQAPGRLGRPPVSFDRSAQQLAGEP